jgi:glutathione synthase/RimK-type ligase-like ATP-grasp enzyme
MRIDSLSLASVSERFIIVGNPENRRVTGFAAALAEAGLPPPTIVPWLSVARLGAEAAFAGISEAPAFVRIDSFGENAEVEAELLRLGFEETSGCSKIAPDDALEAVLDHGRIVCPRQAHFGLLRLLSSIERALSPRWIVLNKPAAIAELFDKRKTSARYAAAGIRVPRAFPGITNFEALRALDARSVYVKIASSSSASGLAIYSRDAAMTTVELAGDKFYNSRIVRRVHKPRELDRLFSFLLSEGAQVEESIPKARIDNYYFDLRVLVIAGEPAFTVMRQSRHPITNLHLGGRRGDPSTLDLTVAHELAARAAAHHETFHAGVDVLLEAKTHEPYVLETNAFGDLLPNLTRDGLSVYAYEIARSKMRSP